MAQTVADRLREERDRFVGFAFANADLLLELDGGSHVLWVGGAVKSILDTGTFNYRVSGDVQLKEPTGRNIPYRKTGVVTMSGIRD